LLTEFCIPNTAQSKPSNFLPSHFAKGYTKEQDTKLKSAAKTKKYNNNKKSAQVLR